MIHELKTDKDIFEGIASGALRYTIRKNDRDFKSGDVLKLMETVSTDEEMKTHHDKEFSVIVIPEEPLEYTGRVTMRTVTHILHGPIYGLMDGWVIMSLI